MGKGDRRTKRGKIWRGTYGVSRPRKNKQKQNTSEKKAE
ncbi:30S ribosomal protein S31 [Thermonema lapsum]|jgi:30S ribosomal protein S31|uniref:30S ribosomal protein S31 n=1 Tax=Thermonema lapsum TaxID=28195 RepID=A0A846MMX5_9BACT|nr:30S ribosomal protein THX [Thermonema lapsum]NIK72908.1 30S ribosomal protein S31 [Thermonema lapsum]